jgi:aminotransferase
MKNRSAIAASGHKFRTQNISRRIQSIVISPIKEMSILADEFARGSGGDIVSFGQGIPYLQTPLHIRDAVKLAVDEPDTGKYTLEPGITELRELVGRQIARSKNIADVQPQKEIMITVGCQEAVACALMSVIDPGDEVLFFSPGYASHMEQVVLFGGQVKCVNSTIESGWSLDLGTLEAAVNYKTKALIFSNPCNPTGKVFSRQDLETIADFAIKHDLIVISDETYDFLTYDGIEFVSMASLPQIRGRLILCGSFSKKFGMTGYRVGYAYSDSGIIDHMLKAHDALAICAPAVSQKAAIAALSDPGNFLPAYKERLMRNRELMCGRLAEMGDFFEFVKPQGAYYILARYKMAGIDSFDLALRILREARVILIPGQAFGPTGENCLRFSFAGDPAAIEEGFNRLKIWQKKI